VLDENGAIKAAIAEVFGRAAVTYDRVGPHFFTHFGQRLVERAQIPGGAKVLDVAAGRGAVLFPAADHAGVAGHVTGIDLAQLMVAATAAEITGRGVANATMCQMDAEQLAFPAAAFDYVLSGFALTFFPDCQRVLSECRRVLRPGGRIVLSSWEREDGRWRWYGELLQQTLHPGARRPSSDPPPAPYSTGTSLSALLQQAGFVEVEVVAEEAEFMYRGADEWWAVQWSHGSRYPLDLMPPDVLTRFKATAFERIAGGTCATGIPQRFSVLFALANSPR
jgi:ubiquinone/menaquinone biosynthesis C-methylase UbiE